MVGSLSTAACCTAPERAAKDGSLRLDLPDTPQRQTADPIIQMLQAGQDVHAAIHYVKDSPDFQHTCLPTAEIRQIMTKIPQTLEASKRGVSAIFRRYEFFIIFE